MPAVTAKVEPAVAAAAVASATDQSIPFVRLSDAQNPAHPIEDTVVFLRQYNSWGAGQSAGFLRPRAKELIRAGIARPYNPAVDRADFSARTVKK